MSEKPRIAAGGVLSDINAGMDESALMQKYRLSAKGLQSLFQKLVSKGLISTEELEQRQLWAGDHPSETETEKPQDKRGAVINPSEAVRDIRSGMHDFDLMAKFKLSAKGLQSLFDHLVKAGLMDQSEFERRMPALKKQWK